MKLQVKIKKETIKLGVIIVLLLSCLGFLYCYFFIRTDTNWMFWKQGETIAWDTIEYDDDFWPTDTIETYGEYGEWQFKEFKPIYAGYGTTDDGLDYLIGKYLDEKGKEKTVNILLSGEGMEEYPYADGDFTNFFNNIYKENVTIRQVDATKITVEVPEYNSDDEFIGVRVLLMIMKFLTDGRIPCSSQYTFIFFWCVSQMRSKDLRHRVFGTLFGMVVICGSCFE